MKVRSVATAWMIAGDPENPADRNDDRDRYTNLEEYLNSLIPTLSEALQR